MLRWHDGFDYYATADLASQYNIVGGAWTTVASIGRFGSGALQNGSSGGGQVLSKFFDNQPTWVVGFAYKFTVGGIANIICSIESSGSYQVELRLNSSNILTITANGTVLATGTTPLLTNTFYFIEFKVTIGTSISANTCQANLAGALEVNVAAAANTDPQAAGSANRVALHYDTYSYTNTFDDFYVLDGTGSVNNNFLGDMRVETLVMNASGNYSEWSVHGSGTAVGAVDEATEDGDTTYIYSNTLNQRETFTYPPLSSTPSSVAGIKMTAITRKDDAGSRAITPLIRVASTDYLGTQIGMTDTYVYLVSIFETNPGTSLPWTGSDVNALEAGWKLTT